MPPSLITRLAALTVATVLGLAAAVSLSAPTPDPEPVRPTRIESPPTEHHGAHAGQAGGLSRDGLGTAEVTQGAP